MSRKSDRIAIISSTHTVSWLMLIGANVLWASSYVAAKWALLDTSVMMVLALRMCISGLILLPFLFLKRKDLHLTKRDIPHLMLLAIIGFMVNKMLEFGGLSLSTASDVALLIAGESIFTLLLSWILLHEPVRKRTILPLILGIIGVYLIVERSIVPNIPAGGGAWRIVGDLMVILALVCEAFYTVTGKTLLVKHSPLLITSASIIGSMIFWLPVAGIDIALQGWHMPSLLSCLCIVWLAIGCTVLAYLAWFQGLTKIHSSTASSSLFLQPLIGPILGILLLHDSITSYTVIGGIFIIMSVYLISRLE